MNPVVRAVFNHAPGNGVVGGGSNAIASDVDSVVFRPVYMAIGDGVPDTTGEQEDAVIADVLRVDIVNEAVGDVDKLDAALPLLQAIAVPEDLKVAHHDIRLRRAHNNGRVARGLDDTGTPLPH